MGEGLVNKIDNIPNWFLLNASILALDLVSLLIDGLFYKALTEAPQAILNHADANALKTPVLVFVVLVCIIQLINIWFSVNMHFNPEKDDNIFKIEKKKWPVILSVLVVWIDFAQIVIGISTAFRTNQLIGKVQFSQPVFALIKTFCQISALVRRYLDKNQYSQIDADGENCLINYFKRNRFCSFQNLVIIALAGFILNCCCSVFLLVRVSMNL